MEHLKTEEKLKGKPLPTEFDKYLFWACYDMDLPFEINITTEILHDYTNISKAKAKYIAVGLPPSTDPSASINIRIKGGKELPTINKICDQSVAITTSYNTLNQLLRIKFDNNRNLPAGLIAIIGKIVRFHPNLANITINRGLDNHVLHEICKMLPFSNITDICLDCAHLKSGDYHLLLETQASLRQLSLSKCKIEDNTIKNIAAALIYPSKSSTSLSILNLASNEITDKGAKYLAVALRSNRRLSYLNLADNRIGDEGAALIFNSLKEFFLIAQEITDFKCRKATDMTKRCGLILQILEDVKAENENKKKSDSIVSNTTSKKEKADQDEDKDDAMIVDIKESINTAFVEANKILGEFDDPFSNINTVHDNELIYCKGNNKLAYLNIAYNDLTVLSLKKLLEVVNYQKSVDRKPKGLINVNVDGNNLPVNCLKLININSTLNESRKPSASSRKNKKSPLF